ncbi:riboflavin synthase [Deltaproteobacteria bacterium OttesenSCG-928-M10]|nr:riboflavin synthase [Deltaproteobacteria bacterium OttesenSCG-928-M10]
MFTGLTLGTGEISRRLPKGAEVELTVTAGFDWDSPLQLGESIAVSGVCLTVTEVCGPRGFRVYASAETLRLSTLSAARLVNLERALALGDRLGGHLVSGHVDGPGQVHSISQAGSSLVYKFGAERGLMPFIVPKGSIAIDGVSLTVNEVAGETFTVNLIPHTSRITTLGSLKPGDKVNLETDLIGKYVHRLMNVDDPRPGGGLTLEFLARHGFSN